MELFMDKRNGRFGLVIFQKVTDGTSLFTFFDNDGTVAEGSPGVPRAHMASPVPIWHPPDPDSNPGPPASQEGAHH